MQPAQVPNAGLVSTNSESFGKAALAQQIQKHRRLAAGNNEPVNRVELLRLAHQHRLGAEFGHAAAMGIKVALQG